MQILLQVSTYSSGYKVYLETCFLSPIVKRKTYNYQNHDIKVKGEITLTPHNKRLFDLLSCCGHDFLVNV